MQNQNMPAHDREKLEAIAELLLWVGWDRVADRIYAQLEAEAWREVFDS